MRGIFLTTTWRNVSGYLMLRGSLLLGALIATMLLLCAPRVGAEVVYAINDSGIFSMDSIAGSPTTQLVTFSPALAADSAVTLATRPSDGMLFYLDTRGVNPNLWRWDPSTPTVSPVIVGTPGATTTNVIRLGFDAAGTLYAMNSGVGTSVWTLDVATGGILSVKPASGFNNGDLPDGGDLCLHPSTGSLYMITDTRLYTLTSAGFVTLLGTISGLPNSARGCAFDRNGQLFVSQDMGLYRVNIGTLSATAMANVGILFGDLASNGDPNVRADLRVTKTASNPTPGTTVSFTVSVANDGPSRATDVRVLDLLPAGLTFVSATASQGSYSPTAVAPYPAGTWRVGTLNNAVTATLTINATVTGTTPITNWAQVSYADQYDPDSTPGSAVPPAVIQDDQASVTITPSPDLRIVKAATSSFAVGTNATYSITVDNTLGSLGTSGSYTVTDNMPTGLSLVSASGTGWNCTASTPAQMNCSSSTVIAARAGNANSITLTVLPAAAAAPSVDNTATVAGGGEPVSNTGNNSSTVSTAVCSASCPDLLVNKSLSTASLTVGTSTSVYTLNVRNGGGLSTGANNYVISDTLPAGLTLAAVPTAGAGWTCTIGAVNGTQVTCNSSTAIAAGGTSSSVTFRVNVSNLAAPGVTNTAGVSGGGEPANATGNNNSSLSTPVIDFDLTIDKTGPATFTLGANGTYTLTVANIGARVSSGIITVTDTLPAGLTFVSGVGTNWTPCTATGQVVTCTRSAVSTIAAGSAAIPTLAPPITLTVSVAALAAPGVTNTASVNSPNESPNLLENNSSTLLTPVAAPDLVVTKSHNGNFTVGVNGVYTLTVSNIGKLATSLANVVVTDTLPNGLGFVSGTGTGWSACTATGQVVTCNRLFTNAIAATSSAPPITLTVSVGAAAGAGSPVTNNVSVAGGNEPAGNAGNNSDSDITFANYSPVITKSFSPASVAAGVPSTLTLTISNPAGNSLSLAGLAVVDPFPPGMAVATTPAFTNSCGGVVSPGTGQGDSVLSLTGGATGPAGSSCTITVQVTSTTVGANLNTTGQVTSSNSGTGAPASATLTVTAPGSPTLTKLTSPNPVGVNQPATLTFSITNKTTTTNGMGFTDTLPAGVVVSNPATFGGTCNSNTGSALARTAVAGGNSITVTGVDLAANATCTVTINVQSATAGSYANTSANISNLSSGLVATGLSDTLVVQRTTLTKAFAPSTVAVNGVSTMTFTIANGADAPGQSGLAFTETLPAGVTVALVPNSTQCSGTVTAAVGSGTVTFSGGALPLSQSSCSIAVSVTSSAAGTYRNQTTNVTGVSANIFNDATATLLIGSPSLVFMKTVAVISDPVNGSVNPKNIPGAVVEYRLRVTNTGTAAADSDTTVLIDPIPADAEFSTSDLAGPGSGPVLFVQGSPSSTLSWSYTPATPTTDDLDFSNDNGVSWSYIPTPPYDASINRVRLNPKGSLAGSNASFELRFRVRVK